MRFLQDRRIGFKMLAGYLVIALVTAILGTGSTIALQRLLAASQATYHSSTEPLGSLGRLGIVVQRSRVNIRGMLLDESKERMEANAATIRKNDGIIDNEISLLEKSITKELQKDYSLLRKAVVDYRPIREKIIALALEGKKEEALDLMRGDGLVYEKEIDATVGRLVDLEVKHARQILDGNTGTARMSINLNMILVVAGIGLAVALGIILPRMITKPLEKTVEVATAIAGGDLTRSLDIQGRDEVGVLAAAMNEMGLKLRHIIATLSDDSATVTVAAANLKKRSTLLADGTEEMAAKAGTLAAAGEEMAATSNDIAANCHHVADGAKRASDSAINGSSIVSATVQGMERIADRVKETATTIERLGKSSDKIGAIIGTIEDIADQTNLLALNAAIEAARAGEQGRGFAVVADEVRALAERTSRATREISAMIKGIQQETREAVLSMEEGVTEVVRGTEGATASYSALEEITRMIENVSMQVSQIATAAEEQTATTAEISSNIQDITNVVEESSRGAQESAAEADELAALAEDLRKVVEQFKLAG